jgi:hypothetical protein
VDIHIKSPLGHGIRGNGAEGGIIGGIIGIIRNNRVSP